MDLYHGAGEGEKAERAFDDLFKKHEIPDDVPEFACDLTPNDEGKVFLAKLLVEAGLVKSTSDACRMIDQGSVKVNGEKLAPKSYNVDPGLLVPGTVLQVGKRRFVKLV